MTPEILVKHYRGPNMDRYDGRSIAFRWFQKGRRYPRQSFWLQYHVEKRRFFVFRVVKVSSRAKPVIVEMQAAIEVFTTRLTPEHIAHCAATSLARSAA